MTEDTKAPAKADPDPNNKLAFYMAAVMATAIMLPFVVAYLALMLRLFNFVAQ
jgi:hypothetical protein